MTTPNKLTLALRETEKEFDEEFCEMCDTFDDADRCGENHKANQDPRYFEQIEKHHSRLLTAFEEMVEGIDVSGGGSGRRLKEQLLSLLNEAKKEVK